MSDVREPAALDQRVDDCGRPGAASAAGDVGDDGQGSAIVRAPQRGERTFTNTVPFGEPLPP